MATITQELTVYYRPSYEACGMFPYSFADCDIQGDADWIQVSKITVSFQNNIDTRAAQVELIDKALEKLNADHYAKKTQLEARRNELLSISCDSATVYPVPPTPVYDDEVIF